MHELLDKHRGFVVCGSVLFISVALLALEAYFLGYFSIICAISWLLYTCCLEESIEARAGEATDSSFSGQSLSNKTDTETPEATRTGEMEGRRSKLSQNPGLSVRRRHSFNVAVTHSRPVDSPGVSYRVSNLSMRGSPGPGTGYSFLNKTNDSLPSLSRPPLPRVRRMLNKTSSTVDHLDVTRSPVAPSPVYPTHQPQYASPGIFPSVRLEPRERHILSDHNSHMVHRPVTVKIAPPDILQPPLPVVCPVVEPRSEDDKDPCDRENILSALREKRKRCSNDQDEVVTPVNEVSKRRRLHEQEDVNDDTSEFMDEDDRSSVDVTMDTTMPMLAGVKRPANSETEDHYSSRNGSTEVKRTRKVARRGISNAIDASFCSSRRWKQSLRKARDQSRETTPDVSMLESSGQTDTSLRLDNSQYTTESNRMGTPDCMRQPPTTGASDREASEGLGRAAVQTTDHSSTNSNDSTQESKDEDDAKLVKEANSKKKLFPLKSGGSKRRNTPIYTGPSESYKKVPSLRYSHTVEDFEIDRQSHLERVQQMLQDVTESQKPKQDDAKAQTTIAAVTTSASTLSSILSTGSQPASSVTSAASASPKPAGLGSAAVSVVKPQTSAPTTSVSSTPSATSNILNQSLVSVLNQSDTLPPPPYRPPQTSATSPQLSLGTATKPTPSLAGSISSGSTFGSTFSSLPIATQANVGKLPEPENKLNLSSASSGLPTLATSVVSSSSKGGALTSLSSAVTTQAFSGVMSSVASAFGLGASSAVPSGILGTSSTSTTLSLSTPLGTSSAPTVLGLTASTTDKKLPFGSGFNVSSSATGTFTTPAASKPAGANFNSFVTGGQPSGGFVLGSANTSSSSSSSAPSTGFNSNAKLTTPATSTEGDKKYSFPPVFAVTPASNQATTAQQPPVPAANFNSFASSGTTSTTSGFAFGATSGSTSSTASSTGGFQFSAKTTAVSTSSAAPSTFSFGPSVKAETKPASTFAFGQASKSEAKPSSTFTFGGKAGGATASSTSSSNIESVLSIAKSTTPASAAVFGTSTGSVASVFGQSQSAGGATMSFGQTDASKTDASSNFSFGQAKPTAPTTTSTMAPSGSFNFFAQNTAGSSTPAFGQTAATSTTTASGMFGGQGQPFGQSQAAPSNAFGSNNSNAGTFQFGQKAETSQAKASGTFQFGQKSDTSQVKPAATAAGSGLFSFGKGATLASSGTTSTPFGAPSNTTSKNLFGGSGTSSSTVSNPFGAGSTNPQSQTQQGGPFGQMGGSSTTTGFGQQANKPSSSVFAFGQSTSGQSGGSVFGQTPSQSTGPAAPAFGQSSGGQNMFGSSQATTASKGFDFSAAASGSTAPAVAFGGNAQTPSTGGFNFGQAQAPAPFGTPQSSGMGATPFGTPGAPNPFGAPTPSTPSNTMFTLGSAGNTAPRQRTMAKSSRRKTGKR